ncbi:hypothetical protein NEOKW01_0123 [Nematocida sp. AWRm80]|nr:hypothetical protein NEOKW01_0123 [Nematocida sp. AWRm80]
MSSKRNNHMEYTKQEAFRRYMVIWTKMNRKIRTEGAIRSVKEKLKENRRECILLEDTVQERHKETAENTSFIGMSQLSLGGLLTGPLELESAPEGIIEVPGTNEQNTNTEQKPSNTNRRYNRRSKNIILEDSEEENTQQKSTASSQNEEDSLTLEELSSDKTESEYSEIEEELQIVPIHQSTPSSNTTIEIPIYNKNVFNKAGIDKVKDKKHFKWN